MDCGSSVLPEARNINVLDETVWRRACAWTRVEFVAVLERLDLTLMEERPEQLRNEGFRERTPVTRVGELRFWRRCYRDEETGKYRYLLDEALELAPRVRLSDGLVTDGVALAPDRRQTLSGRSPTGGRRRAKEVVDLATGLLRMLRRASP